MGGKSMETPQETGQYRNTIGSIVSWAIFRAAGVIIAAYIISEYVRWLDYSTWWVLTLVVLYAVVLHPMQIQYRIYKEETARVMDGTLCSTCRHFEPTGVLCSKLDEHVTEDSIPCEGQLWEPK
jgi:membrane protein YdbS with pleckstrin-like domain